MSKRTRVLHELQRARRLPGDHPRIVVGVNEVGTRPVDELLQGRLARGGARLALDHRPAIPAHGGLLGLRRRPRHHDRGADPPPPRGVAEGQGMIARGVGRDTPLRLLVGQSENRVAGAPNLEGACFLEILTLEEQVRPGQPVQVRARQHRRAMDVGANPLARGLHIFKGGDVHGAVFRLAVGRPSALGFTRVTRHGAAALGWYLTARTANHTTATRSATRVHASATTAVGAGPGGSP